MSNPNRALEKERQRKRDVISVSQFFTELEADSFARDLRSNGRTVRVTRSGGKSRYDKWSGKYLRTLEVWTVTEYGKR